MPKLGAGTLARLAAIVAITGLASSTPLPALTDEEIFRDLRFNMGPGARALGLGGAFVAVSADATAAITNPAGLALIARPEIFTEIRNLKADDSTWEDTVRGDPIIARTRPNAVFSPSFISYVHPWKRWAVGISRFEVNKASNRTDEALAIRISDPDPNRSGFALWRGAGQISTDVSVWNVTGAVNLGEKISAGASVARGNLNVQSRVRNTFTAPMILPYTLYETSIDDRDTDLAVSVGVHVRPSSRVSFGLAFRGGFDFDVTENIVEYEPTGLPATLSVVFNTPDSFGAGVSWLTARSLRVSLEWVHINYSDQVEGFQGGPSVLNSSTRFLKYDLEDADELHLGGEYVFTAGTSPWAVRAGLYTDSNTLVFSNFSYGGNYDKETAPRDTEIHFTAGTGLILRERFQIDVAADFSQIANQYSLSTVLRF